MNINNDNSTTECHVCSHRCMLKKGSVGYCGVRTCSEGKSVPINYGKLTSMALDPIEKKPLAMFMPGSMILSVGSMGCNMKCMFCQNYGISQEWRDDDHRFVSPEELAQTALRLSRTQRNIGVAFTYNEPLVCYEYVRDTAKQVHELGLKNVLVSNGQASDRVFEEIISYVDAMNIDLKAFSHDAYRRLGGDLDITLRWIERSYKKCHLEITSLIVPKINDSLEEMEREAKWIASLDPDIPLHITRFFPRYKYTKEDPTDIDLMRKMEKTSKQYLKNVFLGNV